MKSPVTAGAAAPRKAIVRPADWPTLPSDWLHPDPTRSHSIPLVFRLVHQPCAMQLFLHGWHPIVAHRRGRCCLQQRAQRAQRAQRVTTTPAIGTRPPRHNSPSLETGKKERQEKRNKKETRERQGRDKEETKEKKLGRLTRMPRVHGKRTQAHQDRQPTLLMIYLARCPNQT